MMKVHLVVTRVLDIGYINLLPSILRFSGGIEVTRVDIIFIVSLGSGLTG